MTPIIVYLGLLLSKYRRCDGMSGWKFSVRRQRHPSVYVSMGRLGQACLWHLDKPEWGIKPSRFFRWCICIWKFEILLFACKRPFEKPVERAAALQKEPK